MASFQQGYEAGFAGIFTAYYAALCYYACRFVVDKTAAEDIVQDCFIKLWQRHHNFSNMPQVRAYIYKIVRFGCIDYLKRQAREEAIDVGEGIDEPVLNHLIRTETWRQIFDLVESLPPGVGRVIKMLYIEGKSIKETAEELHKSIHTIKSHRARGIALLRKRHAGTGVNH
jgi:RNA polymerase sigma-70 factor (family 1)